MMRETIITIPTLRNHYSPQFGMGFSYHTGTCRLTFSTLCLDFVMNLEVKQWNLFDLFPTQSLLRIPSPTPVTR